MIDIKLIRENPDLVKENIKKKFQDHKLSIVDEVIILDKKYREAQLSVDNLRAERNRASNEIGNLMKQGKKEEAESAKSKVAMINEEIIKTEAVCSEYSNKINKIMMAIPNIIDETVPIGKDDSENVVVQVFGEPTVPEFEVPYHLDILESFDGIDLDSARRVSGARLLLFNR